ncbi:hypothetical protein ABZX92_03320 [Lentzea sp. NPDC006480]|uniref:hypothetical protein n=1 Tax=Lentzea sp. NPDC006480 TaxID=3157176 RepID=UPI0033BEDDC0
MSADFLLDYDNSDPHEDWNGSRGALHWVVDFVADHVRDEELAASMKDFVKGGYGYFALSFYTPEQAAEIVRVIREDLKQGVDAAFPSAEDRNAVMQAMTADLIDKAGRWGKPS